MQGLIEQLEKQRPNRNIVFTAIERLSTEEEIKQFYQEYVEKLGLDTAQANIGYILGYYGADTARRWFNILPEVEHPVFGREISFWREPGAAFDAGHEAGRINRKRGQND